MDQIIQDLIKEALAASNGDPTEAQVYLGAKFDDLPDDAELHLFHQLETAMNIIYDEQANRAENERLRRIRKCWEEGGYDDVPNTDPIHRPQ